MPTQQPISQRLQWLDETSLQCDGVTLRLMPGMSIDVSTDDVISLFKDSDFVHNYMRCLAGHKFRNMVEIGVKHGGSAIFFWHLLALEKLSCIELNESAPVLSRYIDRHKLGDGIHTHFGVDQADKERLQSIFARDFAGELIDLVVDDASHIYTPSLASFEVTFPLIRPGGLYILEDWRASLLSVQQAKSAESEPPLHDLVHEILHFATVNPHIIPSVRCYKQFVIVERGEGALPSDNFSLAKISEYFTPAQR